VRNSREHEATDADFTDISGFLKRKPRPIRVYRSTQSIMQRQIKNNLPFHDPGPESKAATRQDSGTGYYFSPETAIWLPPEFTGMILMHHPEAYADRVCRRDHREGSL
jgi:hypothetical protein